MTSVRFKSFICFCVEDRSRDVPVFFDFYLIILVLYKQISVSLSSSLAYPTEFRRMISARPFTIRRRGNHFFVTFVTIHVILVYGNTFVLH